MNTESPISEVEVSNRALFNLTPAEEAVHQAVATETLRKRAQDLTERKLQIAMPHIIHFMAILQNEPDNIASEISEKEVEETAKAFSDLYTADSVRFKNYASNTLDLISQYRNKLSSLAIAAGNPLKEIKVKSNNTLNQIQGIEEQLKTELQTLGENGAASFQPWSLQSLLDRIKHKVQ